MSYPPPDNQPPQFPPPPPGSPPPGFPPPSLPDWSPYGPAPQGWGRPAYPLDLGRVFELTFSLFRFRWRSFLGATLIITVPLIGLSAIFQYLFSERLTLWFELFVQQTVAGRPFELLRLFPWDAFLLLFLTGVLTAIAAFVAQGAIVRLAANAYSGGQPSTSAAVGSALSRLPSLAAVLLIIELVTIAILAVGIGLAAALIFGSSGGGPVNPGPAVFVALIGFVAAFAGILFVSIRWSLAAQAVMLEGLGALGALGRSWRLVAGSTWRVFGYALVFGLVFGLIAIVISAVVTLVIAPEMLRPEASPRIDPLRSALSSAITSLISVLFAPFPAIGFTLLYFDLRWRRGDSVPMPGGGETSAGQAFAGQAPRYG